MNKAWRFIPYNDYDGCLNMAIDEALLELMRQGKIPFTLRLYGFKPSCVSFGYSQKIDRHFLDKLKLFNIDYVRRPTGGRAVLHHNNLTYSFIGSSTNKVISQSVVASYKQISAGIIKSYEKFGIELRTNNNENNFNKGLDCFDHLSRADLQANGQKIVGSAQLRRDNAILQHGSINLYNQNDSSKFIFKNLNLEEEQKLKDFILASNKQITDNLIEIENAFIDGFSQTFNINFEILPLSAYELELAENIKIKYYLEPKLNLV